MVTPDTDLSIPHGKHRSSTVLSPVFLRRDGLNSCTCSHASSYHTIAHFYTAATEVPHSSSLAVEICVIVPSKILPRKHFSSLHRCAPRIGVSLPSLTDVNAPPCKMRRRTVMIIYVALNISSNVTTICCENSRKFNLDLVLPSTDRCCQLQDLSWFWATAVVVITKIQLEVHSTIRLRAPLAPSVATAVRLLALLH